MKKDNEKEFVTIGGKGYICPFISSGSTLVVCRNSHCQMWDTKKSKCAFDPKSAEEKNL